MAISKIPSAGFQDNVKFRNLIINGDMSIWQRATTATITPSDFTGLYTVDRWRVNPSAVGTWVQSQSTDVPTGQGFGLSLKMDCTTANTSLNTSSSLFLEQRIEGLNLQNFRKGHANAKDMALSFWVKSGKTGTHIIELFDTSNYRHISKSYIINSANTWQKVEITFPGDITGEFNNNNMMALAVRFWMAAGTFWSSGTLNTSWNDFSSPTSYAVVANGQVNLADSTSNEFYITGVQLEAGQTASEFEFLPVDVNLQRCERYCQLIVSGDSRVLATGAAYSTSQAFGAYMFRQRMRTSPTFTVTTGSGYYRFRNKQSDEQVTELVFGNTSDYSTRVNATGSMTAGDAGWFTANHASAKIISDAEL